MRIPMDLRLFALWALALVALAAGPVVVGVEASRAQGEERSPVIVTVTCRPQPISRFEFAYPWMTRLYMMVSLKASSGPGELVRVQPLSNSLRFRVVASGGGDPVALDVLDEITESRTGDDEFRASWEIDPDWGSGFTIVVALPPSMSLEPGRYEVGCELDPTALQPLSGAPVTVEYAAPGVLEVQASRTRGERITEALVKAEYLRRIAGEAEERASYEAALRELGDIGWALVRLGWLDLEAGDCRGAVVHWERGAASYRGERSTARFEPRSRRGYPLAVWAACYELLDQRLRAQQLLEEHLPDAAERERVSADAARALAAMRAGRWSDLAHGLVLAPVPVR